MKQKIYGMNTLLSLLENCPEAIVEIFAVEQKLNQISKKAATISVNKTSKATLDKWFPEQNHQGVAATINQKQYSESDISELLSKSEKPLVLILDGIQDPHNLGACLRSAAAAKVDCVLVPSNNSVGITPTVRKIASGGAELVPLVQVTNLARSIKKLQDMGIWIVGTAAESEQTIYQIDLNQPIGIVMGAEGTGMRRLTAENCDFLARLPMPGPIESLNLSVSTGICLYEALRQRLNLP